MKTNPSVEDIQKRADEYGVKIAHVCREAAVQQSLYCRWKKGTTEPRQSSLNKMALVLDRMIADLEGGLGDIL